MNRYISWRPGFTLFEMVMYVALCAVIALIMTQSLIGLATAYRRFALERDVVASARIAMETLSRETKQARSIYTPTSRFADASGQLSLETPLNPMTSETVSYADFYIDSGRLYVKREGDDAVALTLESVEVDEFTVTRLVVGERDLARIELHLRSRASGIARTEMSLAGSFALRGNY